ncbi:MAG: hypothetical protein D6698_16580 [Gammaproteobacteria bacterium]|nr:MAG: hypothetical protein D6698_16580 [Gammaproteobacteria bacterium]
MDKKGTTMDRIERFRDILSCGGKRKPSLEDLSPSCALVTWDLYTEEDREEIRRKSIEIVTNLNVPLHLGKTTPEKYLIFPWDGKGIYVERSRSGSYPRTEDIIHEAAHYLLSSIRRRKLGDFGLGSPDPIKIRPSKSPWGLKNLKNIDDEETAASALGIALLARVDLVLAITTADDHNWLSDFNNGIFDDEIEKWKREAVGCRKRIAPPLRRSVVHWMGKVRNTLYGFFG